MSYPPLPAEFVDRLTERNPESSSQLIAALELERTRALRINPLKAPLEEIRRRLPVTLQKVPWCESGFYYTSDTRPGLHPYHSGGLYYIQDASAMFPVEVLNIEPGHNVLDLCASPGGKSTQIAGKLGNTGFLLANEYIWPRAKTLAFNLERLGVTNAVATSSSAEQLAEKLPLYFDRILIDAPCSGEGLFRKEPESRLQWSSSHPLACRKIQQTLLQEAAKMLRPGGIMVYSTCTFAEEENEWLMEDFLHSHPEFSALPLNKTYEDMGICITDNGYAKLLPHKLAGEGHFCARVVKNPTSLSSTDGNSFTFKVDSIPVPKQRIWTHFAEEYCPAIKDASTLHYWKDNLYLLPPTAPDLTGIRLARPGVLLGSFKGQRFVPDHALAQSNLNLQMVRVLLSSDDPLIMRYLQGESLPGHLAPEKGYVLICADSFPLGLGKKSEDRINNLFPKGLRINP